MEQVLDNGFCLLKLWSQGGGKGKSLQGLTLAVVLLINMYRFFQFPITMPVDSGQPNACTPKYHRVWIKEPWFSAEGRRLHGPLRSTEDNASSVTGSANRAGTRAGGHWGSGQPDLLIATPSKPMSSESFFLSTQQALERWLACSEWQRPLMLLLGTECFLLFFTQGNWGGQQVRADN